MVHEGLVLENVSFLFQPGGRHKPVAHGRLVSASSLQPCVFWFRGGLELPVVFFSRAVQRGWWSVVNSAAAWIGFRYAPAIHRS